MASYESWTVAQLKDKLKELGLPTDGRKVMLVRRLFMANETDYWRYMVPELKYKLKKRNLSTKGLKSELVNRLIEDDKKNHEIVVHQGFSGIDDTNKEILFKLSYNDIMAACQSSKEMAKICEDDNFWRQKVDMDFGVSKYKHLDQTYKQQYFSLQGINNLYQEGADGSELVLEVLPYGMIDVLQMLLDLGFDYRNFSADTEPMVVPSIEVVEWLLAHGVDGNTSQFSSVDIPTIEWLYERNLINIGESVAEALSVDSIDAIEWWYNHDFDFDSSDLDIACEAGSVGVIDWLLRHGIVPEPKVDIEIDPDDRFDDDDTERMITFEDGPLIYSVLRYDAEIRLKVLEVFLRYEFISQQTANEALSMGQIDTLELLAQYDIIPDENAILSTIRGTLSDTTKGDVIEWLSDHGMEPSVELADKIASELLLLDRGRPMKDSAEISSLILLEKYGVLPSTRGANKAAETGNIKVLDWLFERGILPTEEVVDTVVENQHSDVLQWMLKHNILPLGELER